MYMSSSTMLLAMPSCGALISKNRSSVEARDEVLAASHFPLHMVLNDVGVSPPPSSPRQQRSPRSQWKLPVLPSKDLRCPHCGVAHPKPALVETYRYCPSCAKVLRESTVALAPFLQKRNQPSDELNKLAVLAASFGHPTDAARAIDVTAELRGRVVVTATFSELEIPAGIHLMQMLFKTHADPAPGIQKVLVVRYLVPNFNPELTRHGEIVLEESMTGTLAAPLLLRFHMNQLPKVWINRAVYGHRHSVTPSLVFDVTERLTGLADRNGGDFLSLEAAADLCALFGEPCDHITKSLTLDYEIIGRTGQARQYELDGHLVDEIVIQSLPVVGPAVLVERAVYGWAAKDLEMKLTELHAHVKLAAPGEAAAMRQNELDQYMALQAAASGPLCRDVTTLLQTRVDDEAVPGSQLRLDTDTNLNLLFGDPCPGVPRVLVLEYALLGYGSTFVECSETTQASVGESATDDEIIKKGNGQCRNFCKRKTDKLRVAVTAEGFVSTPIVISSHEIFPSLLIARAFFGHPTNTLKTFDVTEPIGVLAAKGNAAKALAIPRTLDLISAFGDPCRGIRKALTINYQVLGMGGTLVLHVNETNRLPATLVVGYPPAKRDVGTNGKMGFSERVALSAAKTKQTARERMQSSASQRLWSI
ncbi:Aste57867_10755 [Aphanomyces stellatus]|uniref:Aste57867_10755 protein n=1 Tax=Aphanomyces stellatus TaxID=120398 RepID=A0A485KRB2_9STRA|nr:hypothetical protein As57867_010715 [Aphanomyces stellatus]VFT87625.1 Aste57867_10755 [Aphanomyces stellatus]